MTGHSIKGEVCFPSNYNVPLGLNKTHCFPWGQSLIAYCLQLLHTQQEFKKSKRTGHCYYCPTVVSSGLMAVYLSEQMLFCFTKIPSLHPHPIRTSYLTLVRLFDIKLGNHITINSSLSPESEISVLSYHLWKMEQNAM